jgi:predicted lactoylglutathione lyase
MLAPEQVELIHRVVYGEARPAEVAAFRSLVDQSAEARALAEGQLELALLLGKVKDQTPPAHLRQSILEALPAGSPATPSLWMVVKSFVPRSVLTFSFPPLRMEESMATKKAMLIGGTAVAAIGIVVAGLMGYPPANGVLGTIGGNDTTNIAGVQQAGRYRGAKITEKDITLANPEVQAIFQNHDVLNLVKSDAFRAAMKNDAFRSLQDNEAFRSLLADEAFRSLLASDEFRSLLANPAYRSLQADEAFRAAMNSDAMRAQRAAQKKSVDRAAQNSDVLKSDAFRALQDNEAFRSLRDNEAFRALLRNDAFRAAMASDNMRAAMANDQFRAAMANDEFRSLLAKDAYRSLLSAELFRAVSRNAALSDEFMRQALRAQQ